MTFGAKNPFRSHPFGIENPNLVEVPGQIETHETRKPVRKYLTGGTLSSELTTALSPLLPGAPRPSKKVEVERIREVDTGAQTADAADVVHQDSKNQGGSPPKWGRSVGSRMF